MAGKVRPGQALENAFKLQEFQNGLLSKQSGDKVVDIEQPTSLRHAPENDITIKFEDVKYKVTIEGAQNSWLGQFNPLKKIQTGTEKAVLHGISGSVLPGEVLAIMGPSGSGKTTFLSILGGRISDTKGITGKVEYNDLPYNKALKRKIGYVTQDDLFFPHLTVRETLTYAAILRLPKEMSRAEKVQKAEDTIVDLGLEKCKDTVIGGQFVRGISGGERKRVSIGHEILIDPSIILLDEPTSGLDSTTALRIVQLLHKISQSGRTVITTIHQPSSRLFNSFTKLLLLSEGNSIFFGEASLAMPYFASVGFSPLFLSNPADFMLDLASGTTAGISLPAHLEEVEEWKGKKATEQQNDVKEYLALKYTEILHPEIREVVAKLPPASEDQKVSILERRSWNSSWIDQFVVLWTRGMKERRHELWSPLRFSQIFAISFIVGMLWFNSKRDTLENLTDQIGLLFFMALFWGFFTLITAIFTFPQERAMLMKERASDMYRLSSYFMSRTLSEVPMEFLLPVIFIVIAYWMTNLRANGFTFILTLVAILLNITAAQGLGFLIGATVMDVKKGTTLASVILLTFMLSGGYYVQSIPGWIKWVRYIAFTYYAYNFTIKVQYTQDMTYACGDNGSQQCPIEDALRGLTLKDSYVDALALLAMGFIFRALTYVALRRMKTK